MPHYTKKTEEKKWETINIARKGEWDSNMRKKLAAELTFSLFTEKSWLNLNHSSSDGVHTVVYI